MEEKIINQTPVFTDTVEPLTKMRFDISKRDGVFAVLFLLSSVMLSAYGIFAGFRAGFTVSVVITISVITAYLWKNKVKIKVFGLFCGILSVLTVCGFAVTSDIAVRFFGLVSVVLLALVWFMSLTDDRAEIGDLGLFATIHYPIFELVFPNLPNAVISLFTGGGERRKALLKSLLGFAFAIPVLFVVVPLLMSSDAAFSGLAEKIVGNLFLTILKIALGFLIAWFIITYCYSLIKCEPCEIKESTFKGVDGIIISSFLGVISVCYLTYLFSQLAYFFSAFKGFLPEDYSFTAAEYARRGFFEMSVIAAINFGMIFIVLLISAKKNGKICVLSRIFCTFIGFFTLVIIATAISKMVLYIQRFGMTFLRIGTSAFMLFLAVVFISLIFRLFIPRIRVIRTAFITAGIILAILGNLNINSIIAEYNYNAYKNNLLKTIDVSTIYELGDEGVPYLVKLLYAKDGDTAKEAGYYLQQCVISGDYYELESKYENDITVYKIKDKKYDKISEFGISRNRAYNVLDKYIKENP
ncbi:MAG: DUF4173 domain-containing protein, partial [Clostridia bacterium]|nr:DUF4173 domain-containing protein [Clostridia bacterium]